MLEPNGTLVLFHIKHSNYNLTIILLTVSLLVINIIHLISHNKEYSTRNQPSFPAIEYTAQSLTCIITPQTCPLLRFETDDHDTRTAASSSAIRFHAVTCCNIMVHMCIYMYIYYPQTINKIAACCMHVLQRKSVEQNLYIPDDLGSIKNYAQQPSNWRRPIKTKHFNIKQSSGERERVRKRL